MGFRMYEAAQSKWRGLRKSGHLAACIFFIAAFVLAGIAVVVVSTLLLLESQKYLQNDGKESYMYFAAVYILLGAGSLMALVGFLGCCGALRESPCMLGTFFIFLVVIIVAEVTGGVWAWVHMEEFEKTVTGHMKHLVQNDYGRSETITATVDAMQKNLKCCGASGPADWSIAYYNKHSGESLIESGIASFVGAYKVPPSCCHFEGTSCEVARSLSGPSSMLGAIHSQGCAQALWSRIETHMTLVSAIGLGIAALQIIGLILTIVLCCAVRRGDGSSFKA